MNKTSMLNKDSLKDKTILVTGGGSGLGKSMSTEFLRLGANVVIASRNLEKLETAAKEMNKETGGTVLPLQCNVKEYSDVENILSKTLKKFGSLDILVNNAAGNFVSPTERLSHRAFDAVVDIVLKGSYNCTLEIGKYWIKNKIKGVTLNIVTTYAWTGSGYVVPSACAKAGVLAMTRSLGAEWGKYGIRTNAIAPGPFPTEGAWSRLFPKAFRKFYDPTKKIPLKRFGDHQELANLASYLVSDYSAYVNGEVVTIDGGEWIYGAGEFNLMDKIPSALWGMIKKITK
tara:strand:+ start:431 stop:1291 length:861 start_codon:yes stop_codon:yes gene_type:complete